MQNNELTASISTSNVTTFCSLAIFLSFFATTHQMSLRHRSLAFVSGLPHDTLDYRNYLESKKEKSQLIEALTK